MRVKGTITRWNDEKGYGFITPQAKGKDVFVHISDINGGYQRPVTGESVSFKLQIDDSGRACATWVNRLKQAAGKSFGRSAIPEIAVSIVYLVIIGGFLLYTNRPFWTPVWYFMMSLLAYRLYASDKAAAISGSRRISENSLHIVSLIGGWPGALIARKKYRHKTIKHPFRTFFWLTVILNILATAWFLSPSGEEITSKLSRHLLPGFWHETNCEWLSERIVECR